MGLSRISPAPGLPEASRTLSQPPQAPAYVAPSRTPSAGARPRSGPLPIPTSLPLHAVPFPTCCSCLLPHLPGNSYSSLKTFPEVRALVRPRGLRPGVGGDGAGGGGVGWGSDGGRGGWPAPGASQSFRAWGKFLTWPGKTVVCVAQASVGTQSPGVLLDLPVLKGMVWVGPGRCRWCQSGDRL